MNNLWLTREEEEEKRKREESEFMEKLGVDDRWKIRRIEEEEEKEKEKIE